MGTRDHVPFEFYYLAPNRFRANRGAPLQRALAFDGAQFFDFAALEQHLTLYRHPPSAQAATLALARRWEPFLPPGFRAPLLSSHVDIERETYGGAPAVRLRQQTPTSGKPLVSTFWFRWPSMDFLERKVEWDSVVDIRVLDQWCGPTPGLCYPKRLETTVDGRSTLTVLSRIDVDLPLTADLFQLTVPSDGSQEELDWAALPP